MISSSRLRSLLNRSLKVLSSETMSEFLSVELVHRKKVEQPVSFFILFYFLILQPNQASFSALIMFHKIRVGLGGDELANLETEFCDVGV